MVSVTQIQDFYLTAFKQMGGKRGLPSVAVEFYPYVGLRHTIRIRDEQVFVRLSDLTKNAPPSVHQALAFILVAKLLRRRVPQKAAEVYQEFARHPKVTENTLEKRRERGRKIVTSAKGAVYNLDEIFQRLNKQYFDASLKKPVLSWSRGKTFRIFGHHDATHETVIISKTLDDARVPEFVVEFVLYHELLHVKHPTRTVNGRRRVHTAAFRRDEELFPQFAEAEKWLERLSRQNRRRKTSTTR